ncbi:alpha/beta-hydrolase [Trametopsis cervina]|nr:alpha/beta-hydrolase [Trametopsis cervina]
MDPAKYKTTTTTRGFTYNYYFAPARLSKPTLLFCHGFPSTSKHWERQVPFFEDRGYGVIVPDMLGYGGTSKPTDVDAYVPSLISKDLVEVLDAEGLWKVIAVGHDWGSKAISRLANHYPDRFYAYAFFAVPYAAVRPPIDHDEFLALVKAQFGYELFGYWEYLATPHEFDEDFRAHPNSAFDLWFPHIAESSKTTFAPKGALKREILADFTSPLASFLKDDDKKYWIDIFMKNGFDAPTRWYEVMTTKKSATDDLQTIPEGRRFPPVHAPIFFGAAIHDPVCVPTLGYETFAAEEFKQHNITIHDFNGDHWLIFSCADSINKELLRWIEGNISANSHL